MDREALYRIADELRAVASAGLRYSEGGYDRERYEKILRASARLVAELGEEPFESVYAQYQDNLAHLSPLLAVEAVVFREGRVLLIQRHDDKLWAVPGGLAEVGESAAQAATRELWEEAGLRGIVTRLLGFYDTRLWPVRTRMQLYCAQFLVYSDDEPALHRPGESASSMAEALAVGFFAEDALPELSYGHQQRLAMAFRILRGEIEAPYFDR
jgi:ADP-ribose pyrophosphatase YjhB (NUDIX family)